MDDQNRQNSTQSDRPNDREAASSASNTSDTRSPAAPQNVTLSRARKLGFLEAIALTGTVAGAAQLAGIDRRTHYRWLEPQNDPEGDYQKAFDDAREEFRDAVREEVRRRAFEGEKRPIMYQGEQVRDERGNLLWLTEKSDRMLELLAKAKCPEFREKHEVTGDAGGPVKILAVRYPEKAATIDEWTARHQPKEEQALTEAAAIAIASDFQREDED
jgi:hypothetical protein